MEPIEYKRYLDFYVEREKQKVKEIDALNFMLGKYIAIGVNDPKKYPRKPFLEKEEVKVENRVMTGSEMERIIKRNNLILGGKTK